MLRRANGGPGAEAPLDAPLVGCHLDLPDTAHPFRWCAGWLATVGEYHLAIRLAVAFEALPGAAANGGLPRPYRTGSPPYWTWPPAGLPWVAGTAGVLGLAAPAGLCNVVRIGGAHARARPFARVATPDPPEERLAGTSGVP